MISDFLLITNGDAGTADQEAVDEAVAVLRQHAEVEVVATSDLDDLRAALAGARGRTVVVAGGDGSIHAVVQALHDAGTLTDSTLAVIPLGTGNDFARTLGVPLDARGAAEVIAAGRHRRLDVVVDEDDRVTVNSVHLGAGADAGRRGARWKERLGAIGAGPVNLGRLGYPIGALQTAISPPSLRLRVEVDGEPVADRDHPVLMVAIGNGASVGGGTELTPGARPDDGRVDVLIAAPLSALARLGYAVRLPFARHEQHADVRTVRGREVRVTGEPFECNSDGEIDGPVPSRTWRVLPSAYRMVVGDDHDAGDGDTRH